MDVCGERQPWPSLPGSAEGAFWGVLATRKPKEPQVWELPGQGGFPVGVRESCTPQTEAPETEEWEEPRGFGRQSSVCKIPGSVYCDQCYRNPSSSMLVL